MNRKQSKDLQKAVIKAAREERRRNCNYTQYVSLAMDFQRNGKARNDRELPISFLAKNEDPF